MPLRVRYVLEVTFAVVEVKRIPLARKAAGPTEHLKPSVGAPGAAPRKSLEVVSQIVGHIQIQIAVPIKVGKRRRDTPA